MTFQPKDTSYSNQTTPKVELFIIKSNINHTAPIKKKKKNRMTNSLHTYKYSHANEDIQDLVKQFTS